MNELFDDGSYVLLEDCETYDIMYELPAGTTVNAVAFKLAGRLPNPSYMEPHPYDSCVGINEGDAGVWSLNNTMSTKLSVEDVLYRSEDGLTLDELSKIPGAFEEGKQYECVWSDENSRLETGAVYKADDVGCTLGGGRSSRLTPVTRWLPIVGEEAMASDFKVTIRLLKGKQACVEFESGSIDVVQVSCLTPVKEPTPGIGDRVEFGGRTGTRQQGTVKGMDEGLYWVKCDAGTYEVLNLCTLTPKRDAKAKAKADSELLEHLHTLGLLK